MNLKLKYLIAFSFFCTLFLVAPKVRADTCTPVFPATTCSVSGDVSITATVPDTTVTFSGFAPGGSVVYFKEGNFIVGSTVSASNGTFSKSIVSTPGDHTFIVYLTDNEGRTTPEVTLSPVSLSTHSDYPIINIHLPPTISVSKTQASQGDVVTLSGQGSPGSGIDIYVNDIKRFNALVGQDSKWSFALNGGNLADDNTFYAISTRSGLPNSAKSQVVSLQILACTGEQCNRTSTTTTPESPQTPATSSSGTNVTYRVDLGDTLKSWFPVILIISGIFLLLLILILILLIFLLRRRKKSKKDVLDELESKVEKDLTQPNPVPVIKKDFAEAKEEIEN